MLGGDAHVAFDSRESVRENNVNYTWKPGCKIRAGTRGAGVEVWDLAAAETSLIRTM